MLHAAAGTLDKGWCRGRLELNGYPFLLLKLQYEHLIEKLPCLSLPAADHHAFIEDGGAVVFAGTG